MNMTSQYQYLAFVWHHRSTMVKSQCGLLWIPNSLLLVRRFGNNFHWWLCRSWKSLPNYLTLDKKKISIYSNPCIILYILGLGAHNPIPKCKCCIYFCACPHYCGKTTKSNSQHMEHGLPCMCWIWSPTRTENVSPGLTWTCTTCCCEGPVCEGGVLPRDPGEKRMGDVGRWPLAGRAPVGELGNCPGWGTKFCPIVVVASTGLDVPLPTPLLPSAGIGLRWPFWDSYVALLSPLVVTVVTATSGLLLPPAASLVETGVAGAAASPDALPSDWSAMAGEGPLSRIHTLGSTNTNRKTSLSWMDAVFAEKRCSPPCHPPS